MIYIILFVEFFKIGLFSIGGGLATLPYLERLADIYPWFTRAELIDMIAISESTPGPIGINMATFAGYRAGDILGGIIATVSMIIPSLIIICFIARVLTRFKNNKYVDYIFYGIRACVAALILSSALGLINIVMFDSSWAIMSLNIPAFVLFFVMLYGMLKYKKHPIVYIAISAIIGCFIQL